MRKALQINPLKEVKFVMTPGGRVGYVRVRDAHDKTLTIRYLDGTAEDEVTVAETLPGLRVLRVQARDLFREEAAEFDREVSEKRTATGRRLAADRRKGTRGAGGRSAARAP